jgi:hypothetical protein
VNFVDYMLLTAAGLFCLIIVGCIVLATATGHYEPIVAVGVWVVIVAVVAALAAVVQWIAER